MDFYQMFSIGSSVISGIVFFLILFINANLKKIEDIDKVDKQVDKNTTDIATLTERIQGIKDMCELHRKEK